MNPEESMDPLSEAEKPTEEATHEDLTAICIAQKMQIACLEADNADMKRKLAEARDEALERRCETEVNQLQFKAIVDKLIEAKKILFNVNERNREMYWEGVEYKTRIEGLEKKLQGK